MEFFLHIVNSQNKTNDDEDQNDDYRPTAFGAGLFNQLVNLLVHFLEIRLGLFNLDLHVIQKRITFFKGWLLLSQPPGCLCLSTSFST
eukprot:TRINITY_DN2083_c0_g2_i6.p1 TRINITY_DN2083_c0_g2~~TRINITY_DN2083_c0_g2_i6.p1  ORF type:complete len:102 (+),score=14.62 TRINITY_DN2083_c0_g2_i6:45-308(+)